METNAVQVPLANTSHGYMLTGMFRDRHSAENAYHNLHNMGYTREEINLVMSHETRRRFFADGLGMSEPESKISGAAGAGSVLGGTLGVIVGIVAAVGTSVVLPGLGLVIAGPVAGALAGAGAGSVTGGIIGALLGAGLTDEQAKYYEHGVNQGHVMIGVHPHNEEEAKKIQDNWKENAVLEIYR